MRVFAAFLLACVTAIPAGIAMGVSRIARGIFDPPIEFYRPLPPLAYLPLIVIWFGIEETAKIVLIYLACFAPLAMAARAGVKSVMIEQINAAYSMGASKWQVIWHVVIPAAMPEIFTGMRIAIGFGWTTLVAAEMVAATAGLGQMVLNASNFLRTDVVIMGIVVIGVVAYLFDLLMRYVERAARAVEGQGVTTDGCSCRATPRERTASQFRTGVPHRRLPSGRIDKPQGGLTRLHAMMSRPAPAEARRARPGCCRRCRPPSCFPSTGIRCSSRCPARSPAISRRRSSAPRRASATRANRAGLDISRLPIVDTADDPRAATPSAPSRWRAKARSAR